MEKMSATRFLTSLKVFTKEQEKKGVALLHSPFSGLNMVATQTKNPKWEGVFGPSCQVNKVCSISTFLAF